MKKIIKITTIILIFTMLMPLALSSCIFENDPEEHDLIAKWEKNLADENGVIKFGVGQYCYNALHDGLWSHYYFEVENGQIYIHGSLCRYLYDTVTYAENVDFEYDEGLLMAAERLDTFGKNISETLQKIKDQKGGYIIETKDMKNDIYSGRMLIYEFEGAYYFLPWNCEDNKVYTVSMVRYEDEQKCPFLSLFE